MAAVRGESRPSEAAPPSAPGDAPTGGMSRWGAVAVALAGMAAVAATRTRAEPGLLLSPGKRAAAEAAGTWSEMFDPSDLANRAPVAFWVAGLVLVGLIGLPYAWLIGSALPDRGWAISRPLGLLLVAWPVWLLASVDLVPFVRGTVAGVALAVAVGAAAIVLARRHELAAWLRSSLAVIVVAEVVFWAIFAAGVLVRWSNPDLWHPTLGGEKPMDFAFLNATLKSESFPPYDPWFAGGYINYYYFGFVLVAVLVKLTAIVPAVAYNLAVPTLAALFGAAAFGATLGLLGRGEGRVPRRLVGSAVLASLFAAVIGNLAELKVVLESINRSIPIDWWYWNASRVIAHPPTEPGPITEFPAFTFLYADLHAHAMALPFTAVILVLLIADVRARDVGAIRFGRLALIALLLGTLWGTNTWDVPTYAALTVALLVLGALARGRRPIGALVHGAVLSTAVFAAAYVLFLPFHTHYRSTFTGVELWRGGRTTLLDYLTIHGFFLFLIAAALAADLWLSSDLNAVARTVRLALKRPRRLRRLRLLRAGPLYLAGLGLTGAASAVAIGLAVSGAAVAAVVVVLATLATLLLVRRKRRRPGSTFLWQATLLFVLFGLAITVAVEYLVVADIDIGRTNTVFKTYLQVWVLWALAAAVAAHRVYERLERLHMGARIVWRAGFVVLFGITLLYPILATRAKVDDRFDTSIGRTLDGMAFMERAVYAPRDEPFSLAYDLAAIRWTLSELDGSPVIGEVNTYPVLYGWGNRFAMLSGNPAVIGWDFHERQQRGAASPEAVPQRIADMQRAYETDDVAEAHEIFRRYGVDYFVVGLLERAFYPEGQRKWPRGRGVLWDVVYRNPGAEIYRVRAAAG
jgi:YYY domain-containing protein